MENIFKPKKSIPEKPTQNRKNDDNNNKLTRREFLKKIAKMGGAAVVGGTVTYLKAIEAIEDLRKRIKYLENLLGEKNEELKLLKIKLKFLENKDKFPITMQVVATAYTAGPESTGKKPGDPGHGITKSGWPANIGAIAVDPDVIPLGSIIYVPDYGYGIAVDTGGAIKGNRIDLYFHNVEDALNWGKKEIEITILGKIELPEYQG